MKAASPLSTIKEDVLITLILKGADEEYVPH